MKKLFVALLLICSFSLNAQKSTPLPNVNAGSACQVMVVDAVTQQVFKKNIGFYTKFRNDADKGVDAIDYEVTFRNGFDEVKGVKTYTWQANNMVGVLKPHEYKTEVYSNWIEGANKIEVRILRVHFVDGTSCVRNQESKGTDLK